MQGFLKFPLPLQSIAVVVCALSAAAAGNTGELPEPLFPPAFVSATAMPDIGTPTLMPPRIVPELALQVFEERAARQLNQPVSYSANTVIEAELPDTSQHGIFHLRRRFIAPKTLLFTPVKFVGDGFVKSNIIARLLQAEVDHANKGDGARTAITEANYKFSYKGADEIDGRPVHVFHLKPRGKRPGLFKGRIYLDASTGSLCRAEGTLVKSQSFFVKKIDFVQDYADVDGYTLPVHAHSLVKTRVVGRAVLEIAINGYEISSTSASVATTSNNTNQ